MFQKNATAMTANTIIAVVGCDIRSFALGSVATGAADEVETPPTIALAAFGTVDGDGDDGTATVG